ncbi:MAG: esterase-like activity of phytase family protein [Pseudomonadota bacterium]
MLHASLAMAEPVVREVSNFEWNRTEEWFGGLSGIEVTSDGRRAVFVTDRASLIFAALDRMDGAITGVSVMSRMPVRRPNGTSFVLRGRDTEGIAIASDDRTYISFEHRHRVAVLDRATGHTKDLPTHPDFNHLSLNSGLEALAVAPDGSLYALPERPAEADGTTPLYRFANGTWRIAYRLPRTDAYQHVGADFGPDGRLYLLERGVTPVGFTTRVRRLSLGPGGARSETLLTTIPSTYGNLEGLSVWRDKDGQIRLTMVSDNNFYALQRSQIVEFSLSE